MAQSMSINCIVGVTLDAAARVEDFYDIVVLHMDLRSMLRRWLALRPPCRMLRSLSVLAYINTQNVQCMRICHIVYVTILHAEAVVMLIRES